MNQRLYLLLPALLWSGCTFPHGSYARPVVAPSGTSAIAVGGVVPIAVLGAATSNGNTGSIASSVDEFLVIPAAAYDYYFEGEFRSSFGVELSLVSDALRPGGSTAEVFGVYVNPRYEHGISENLSFTVDGNLGVISTDDATVPIIAPQVGLRYYIPTGLGGVILSQGIGTGIVSVFLPGSVAYDIPIPMGESKLHIFPEFRWDPTAVFVGDEGAIGLVFLSGGVTFMIEM